MALTDLIIRTAKPAQKPHLRRADAQDLLDRGIDPSAPRQAEKNPLCKPGDPHSFETVAREWFARFSPTWAASHASPPALVTVIGAISGFS